MRKWEIRLNVCRFYMFRILDLHSFVARENLVSQNRKVYPELLLFEVKQHWDIIISSEKVVN